jgi:hypothetical protein
VICGVVGADAVAASALARLTTAGKETITAAATANDTNVHLVCFMR